MVSEARSARQNAFYGPFRENALSQMGFVAWQRQFGSGIDGDEVYALAEAGQALTAARVRTRDMGGQSFCDQGLTELMQVA